MIFSHGQPQDLGAPKCQRDSGRDLSRPAWRGGGDDPEQAGGEELEGGELARRGGAVAGEVLRG